MEISKDIIKEEIIKMKKHYDKLAELFITKEKFIPECKEIKGSINDFLNIKPKPGKTYPDLKSKYPELGKKGDKTIYMFYVTNFLSYKDEIEKKFDGIKKKDEIKKKKESQESSNGKKISSCRKNDSSWKKDFESDEPVCLYVGSSEDIHQRLKEHLFLCNPTAYAMHLGEWFDENLSKNLTITINVWNFDAFLTDEKPETEDEEPDSDYLQNIEDLLWNHYKPLFGRQGKK